MARELVLKDTLHVLQRSAERNIDSSLVYDTVLTGSESDTGTTGRLGGRKILYKKTHGNRLIVVIAEVVGKSAFLLTTYER